MSKDVGQELYLRLSDSLKTGVCFITAQNKENRENAKIYKQLVMESKFDCRVLIATTVIYNGVNIKDSTVKHIVIPFTTVPNMKQMIGRKRIEENETVNVYFYNPTYSELYSRYMDCIKDYMSLIGIRKNIEVSSFLQLNDLASSDSAKFYYLLRQIISYFPSQSQNCLPIQQTVYYLSINLPLIYKLFCDTCYYIYLLQRIQKGNDGSSIDIWLKHLGIDSKVAIMIEPSERVKDDSDNSRDNLSAYLEQLVTSPLTDSDESTDAFLKLKILLNEYYKSIYQGENIDIHWKNPKRFFAMNKIKALLSSANLPYIIEVTSSNGVKTVKVSRTDDAK